jgi:hypothetical protein
MSSQQQEAPSAPKEQKEKKGLGKFLSRAKTVLKRGEGSSKRFSTMSAQAGAPSKPAEAKSTPLTKAQEARARYEAMQGVSKLSKSELLEERAKKLGERFGLELSVNEWQTATPDDTVLRMDKPIRMRVRRTCHKCNATFSAAKECPNCQHVRCTKCSRHPGKRTEEERIASREKRAALIKAQKENAPIIPDYSVKPKQVALKKPSKTGGQDLVYKKPRQRVRRTCHECQTVFVTGIKTCDKCGHLRCTDCPRDPPKKDKYPLGYPGDVFGPKSVPHYECENCKTLYPTGADNGVACRKCGKEKSDASARAQPRKVEPEPDPEILKQLEARLGALKVA